MSARPDWRDAAWKLLLNRLAPVGPSGRLSICIFHRVLRETDPLFPDEVDVARFDALCGWLASWYNVLPLDEACARLVDGSLPQRALCITFDDGYADNHDLALPILQAHGLSATFFVATGFLNGGRMWNDTVVESIRSCRHEALELGDLGLLGVERVDLSSWEQRRVAMHSLLGAAKYLAHSERLAVVDRIAERAEATLPDDLMMRSEQVVALARAGMQIGAHTESHPILAQLDDAAASAEIAGSKHTLESMLGRPVTLFAYPNGKLNRDYLPAQAELVRRLGFQAAVSTNPGVARRGDGLLHQLPRFTPWDSQRWKFALRLARNMRTSPLPA